MNPLTIANSVSQTGIRKQPETAMNRHNYHSLLRHCKTLKQLQQVHAHAIIQGLLHSNLQLLSCKFLNSYVRFRETSNAINVFRQIPDPDIVSITSLMSLHMQNNQPHKAIILFYELVALLKQLDGFAIVGALSASGRVKHLGLGKSVHGLAYRRGFGGETVVNNALISMYCRNGRICLARKVFDEMGLRDAVSWSSMLHGYVMCEGLEAAVRFFEDMPHRGVVAWTVMITSHVQGGQSVRALELFCQMKSEDQCPTLITIVGVLSACADVGALDLGRAIHGYVNKVNISSDITLRNALIDMYSKSGNLGMAYEIFCGMISRDIYTWTTMISGFAVHGRANQALEVFSEMLISGTRPNEITFVAVLSACSHAGLINEGRKWFEKMSCLYKLKHKLEHYGCMVDILGRGGLLQEAKTLIEEMDAEPDCAIWRSILNASLVHHNVELAETAGKEIMRLEPDDDGVYVLLWNMYASLNRWDDASEVKKKMRSRKLLKKPAYSWVEVDGLVHEFLVEDKTHHLRKDIYQLLEGVTKHLKMDNSIFECTD